jgi:hypothetical protein
MCVVVETNEKEEEYRSGELPCFFVWIMTMTRQPGTEGASALLLCYHENLDGRYANNKCFRLVQYIDASIIGIG